jgi:hypothetical protein
MSRYSQVGSCGSCHSKFRYFLINNSSNDSAYGYCEHCGTTVLLSGGHPQLPPHANLELHKPIPAAIEALLEPCSCGGRFRGDACPRCPTCNAELSAEAARTWIEADARGTAKGWRWQGAWQGVYCIVIENRLVTDNWSRK